MDFICDHLCIMHWMEFILVVYYLLYPVWLPSSGTVSSGLLKTDAGVRFLPAVTVVRFFYSHAQGPLVAVPRP
jgi:hypothetical protein